MQNEGFVVALLVICIFAVVFYDPRERMLREATKYGSRGRTLAVNFVTLACMLGWMYTTRVSISFFHSFSVYILTCGFVNYLFRHRPQIGGRLAGRRSRLMDLIAFGVARSFRQTIKASSLTRLRWESGSNYRLYQGSLRYTAFLDRASSRSRSIPTAGRGHDTSKNQHFAHDQA